MNRNLTYGWQPDVPDHRDFVYAAPRAVLKALPPKADLRKACPAIYDQGQLGSCTANAIAGAIQFELMKQDAAVFTPSRLFIYYNERVMESTVNCDAGAQLKDGMQTVNKQGACSETDWPYLPQQLTKKPPVKAYTDAKLHKVTSYHRLNRSLNQMKACLSDGYPFVFGFVVYDAFETDMVARTGKLNLPANTESQLGGHAVMAVGYDDNTARFIVRNSWGDHWGMKGYFTMPYDYLLNSGLSDDFWTIRMLEDSPA